MEISGTLFDFLDGGWFLNFKFKMNPEDELRDVHILREGNSGKVILDNTTVVVDSAEALDTYIKNNTLLITQLQHFAIHVIEAKKL